MGFGLFPLIFLLMIVPDLFELIIPIIFFVGIFSVFRSFRDNAIRNRRTSNNTSRYSYNQKSANAAKSSLSNADITKIDKKLKSFFKDNLSLNVVEGIDLTTQKGTYTSIDDLYVTYKNEKICRLAEIRNSNVAIYDRLASLLLAFSKESNEVLKEKIEPVKENKAAKLSDAQKYIDKINSLNQKIPNEEVTNGLYQTCDLLNQIDLVNKSKKDDKLTKLYDYYLPILLDVLEKYDELDDSPVKGEEFTKTESKLIKTIILINEALKTIYSGLHEEDYMSLNADITTLQSLLKKDGLVETPFGGNNDKQ